MSHDESELTKVKRQIRAIAEKTVENGATEGEAMIAMKKVGDLLTMFNLSMDEVTLREEPCVTKQFQTGLKKRNVLWECFSGLTKFCGVKIWFSRSSDGMRWSFFGLESDADMAVYLSDFLSKVERTALAEFQRSEVYKEFTGHRQTVTANFKSEFGRRLNVRLLHMAQESRQVEERAAEFHRQAMRERMLTATDEALVSAANAKTGTALICLAKEKLIDAEFSRRGPKLTTERRTSKARYHSASRDAGRTAADRVNLNRPLANGNKPSGYLT